MSLLSAPSSVRPCAVNREEHALVPAEFMKWVWAGGRKLQGLIGRRGAEARLCAA